MHDNLADFVDIHFNLIADFPGNYMNITGFDMSKQPLAYLRLTLTSMIVGGSAYREIFIALAAGIYQVQ